MSTTWDTQGRAGAKLAKTAERYVGDQRAAIEGVARILLGFWPPREKRRIAPREIIRGALIARPPA